MTRQIDLGLRSELREEGFGTLIEAVKRLAEVGSRQRECCRTEKGFFGVAKEIPIALI